MAINWYNKIRYRLGINANRSEVNEDVVDEIVKDICETKGISYLNPDSTVTNFVVFEAVSELYEILASSYGQNTEITVADGVKTDLSVPVKNFLKISQAYREKANEEAMNAEGLEGGIGSISQNTMILASEYEAIEEPPLSKPNVNIRTEGSTTLILWDVDISTKFKKTEVFFDGSSDAAYSTTSRYNTQYSTTDEISSVKVVKTDNLDREVYTEITL